MTPIITKNNNVLMKQGKIYLLNQKEVGGNFKMANKKLTELEKKQDREIKRDGFISTYKP